MARDAANLYLIKIGEKESEEEIKEKDKEEKKTGEKEEDHA